jgi:hypothetical protein
MTSREVQTQMTQMAHRCVQVGRRPGRSPNHADSSVLRVPRAAQASAQGSASDVGSAHGAAGFRLISISFLERGVRTSRWVGAGCGGV